MKKLISLLLSGMLIFALLPLPASASAGYKDVPVGSWAASSIEKTAQYKLMDGIGGGDFGYGAAITRAQFVTILCRMFAWESTDAPGFSDVAPTQWYAPYINTALAHDVVDAGKTFRPDAPILREEMAVMLVRALGYKALAESASAYSLPFTDIAANRGYIAIAYDIGMINGTSASTFSPSATAKREEAAAMLVRVYEKLKSKTEWLQGFYAFSSYAQREVTREMDAVTMGWSRLSYSADKGAYLNTGSANGNEWTIPQSYESIVNYLDGNGTPMNLGVYMDTSDKVALPDGTKSNAARAVLLDETLRAQAVTAITDELTRVYSAVGKNPYSGVTIDFEGLKGAELKAGLNAFLTALSAKLKPLGKALYVTVQPATVGEYFDGFDYRTIGELADRVILMAHDYNATSLAGFEGSSYYKTTALTPIEQVYYSLRAATDAETGVRDRSKLALALSFSSLAWQIKDGKLISPTPATPAVSTIYKRLLQPGTVIGWSEQYQNPYATYSTEDGSEYFLWYEDARSVTAKLQLARLFGINGVSVWRIGNLPNYPDPSIFYNLPEA
ncbi:MAG: S-layer homology domain-containing protein, partial [Oscillospiraceae bacterium]